MQVASKGMGQARSILAVYWNINIMNYVFCTLQIDLFVHISVFVSVYSQIVLALYI